MVLGAVIGEVHIGLRETPGDLIRKTPDCLEHGGGRCVNEM